MVFELPDSSASFFPTDVPFSTLTINTAHMWQQSSSQYLVNWGARSWLRHCATSRKVAGSIPDGVIGIFHWHNPFGRTMALGSTQPLTEMSTRNAYWGVKATGA
jgi:hypothetical protein